MADTKSKNREEIKTLRKAFNKKVFTMNKVSKHNTKKSQWIVVYGGVYDLTVFNRDHPGGPDVLFSIAGQDATEEFDNVLHSATAKQISHKYLLGSVKGSDFNYWLKNMNPNNTICDDVRTKDKRFNIFVIGIFECLFYCWFAICSLVYGLFRYNPGQPFDKYFDSITANDSSFLYHDIINNQQRTSRNKEKQRRDKIIQCVLRIYSLNTAWITKKANKKLFSKQFKFDDPLVSYSDYDEFSTCMRALSILCSSKVEDIVGIQHYESLIVIKLKVRYMTPFAFINKHVWNGIQFHSVLAIQLDDTNSCVTRICDFWNGKRLLSLFGLIEGARRMTALVTLPILSVSALVTEPILSSISYLTERIV
eukprot:236174_1